MLVYDSARQRLLLYGGLYHAPGKPPVALRDTWQFDPSVPKWTQLDTNGPNLATQAGAYDPVRQLLVIVGTPLSASQMQGWTWNSSSWTQMASGAAPSARVDSAVAFDTSTKSVLLFSGSGTLATDDTWLLDSSGWHQQQPGLSPSRRMGALLVDTSSGLLLYGGSGFADAWSWSSGSWHEVSASSSPGPRTHASGAWTGTRLILFGGQVNDSTTWAWDGLSWTKTG